MKVPYAKLMSAMWAEESDFRNLPALAQRCYMVIISQANISNCGVLPLAVKRWARLAPDTEIADIEAALAVLSAEQYVVIEDDTDELWVRSWMKYDGLMAIHNGPKGVARSIESVLSTSLKRTVRSTAYVLAPETQKALFEPPHQPGPQGGSQGPSNYSSNSSNTHNNGEQQQQHTGSETGSDPVAPDGLAAALDHCVELRRATATIRNPKLWEKGTREGLVKDYGSKLTYLLESGVEPEKAARVALGFDTEAASKPEAWHANPHCQECDGTGHARDEDDRFGPCDCRRSEPYMAEVIHLHGEAM